MNQDQQLISWLAVTGLIIGIWLVYRQNLSAIIFGSNPTQTDPGAVAGSAAGQGLSGTFNSVPAPFVLPVIPGVPG